MATESSLLAAPGEKLCDGGVVSVGHNGVTVKGGSVREFAVGVLISRARNSRVLHVSSARNQFFGFIVAESAQGLVRDSSGNTNPAPDGDGLGLFGSHDIRVVDSAFRNNALGIHIESSNDNLIAGNVVSENEQLGVFIEADGNKVRRNRFIRNRESILVGSGNRNLIARNRILEGVSGIGIEKGRGNVVARNVVTETRRVGIRLGIQPPPVGGVRNVVLGNRVRGSDGDGLRVFAKDRRSLLKGNFSSGAGDDGFDIDSHSTRLSGNRAVRNADLGIEAARGVTDGGGNTASGNGDPAQCRNVACR